LNFASGGLALSMVSLGAVHRMVYVLLLSVTLGGDIVHHDDVAPMRPGCDNNFVLVPIFLLCILLLNCWIGCGMSYSFQHLFLTLML